MNTKLYRDNFPFGHYASEKDAVSVLQAEVNEENHLASALMRIGANGDYAMQMARQMIERENTGSVLFDRIRRKR